MSSIASVSSTRRSTSDDRHRHVERTERDLLTHGRREHLRIGVLEDEADPRAEALVELLVFKARFGDRLTERGVRASVGEQESVEQLEQRGLPATVRADESDFLAAADAQ